MDDNQALIRKFKYNSSICGIGIIVFGFWSVIKTGMGFTMGDEDIIWMIQDIAEELDYTMDIIYVIIGLICTLVYGFLMTIHIYIGINAINFAKGKKYSKPFIVVTMLTAVITLLSMRLYIDEIKTLGFDDISFTSMIVDITVIFTLIDLIRNYHMVKKLSG